MKKNLMLLAFLALLAVFSAGCIEEDVNSLINIADSENLSADITRTTVTTNASDSSLVIVGVVKERTEKDNQMKILFEDGSVFDYPVHESLTMMEMGKLHRFNVKMEDGVRGRTLRVSWEKLD